MDIQRPSRAWNPAVKALAPDADHRRMRSAGGWAGTERNRFLMKAKMYRLGLTVAMLAVLVESLGAGMKWG
jgi:hypothetical protein